MAINIVKKQPDVNVTSCELAKYKIEYERDHMFYSGTPPTLEEYIRNKQQSPQHCELIAVKENK